MFPAIMLTLVTVGSVVFHFWSPWWWTEVASNWGNIDDTIILTFWVTGSVFVAVCLFSAYCVWKFQYREDRKADYQPENAKLEWWLTIGTAIGVAALLAPGLIVWNQYVTVPDDAYEVEVMAQQWYWSYRLPGEDGILGTSDINNMTDDNPFGLNPEDKNGFDDVLISGDDIHILIDRPTKILLRSIDVLHNFYVPQFRAKMDMVPGSVTYYWFTPTRTGNFEILCAEYCGTGHYAMRGRLLVDNEKEYLAWLDEQMTFEEMLAKNGSLELLTIASNNNE